MPLDGDHIVAVISPRIWVIGVPMLVALYLWRPSPRLIIVALLAVPKAWAALRGTVPLPPEGMRPSTQLKAQYAAEYLGLVSFLTLMAFEAHGELLA